MQAHLEGSNPLDGSSSIPSSNLLDDFLDLDGDGSQDLKFVNEAQFLRFMKKSVPDSIKQLMSVNSNNKK
jgi:hypothetical protein